MAHRSTTDGPPTLDPLEPRAMLSLWFANKALEIPQTSSPGVFVDLDDDRDLDLAWSSGDSVFTQENLDNQGFGDVRRHQYRGMFTTIIAGDVNADGAPDLIVDGLGESGTSRVVRVFLNDGDGNLQRPRVTVLQPSSGVTGHQLIGNASIDADPDPEVLFYGQGSLVAFNVVNGRLAYAAAVSDLQAQPLFADLNGDDAIDMTDGFSAWPGGGNGVAAATPVPIALSDLHTRRVHDFVDWDGDGLQDAVLTDTADDGLGPSLHRLLVAPNLGSLSFGSPHVVLAVRESKYLVRGSFEYIGDTDVNGDGRPDLMFAASSHEYLGDFSGDAYSAAVTQILNTGGADPIHVLLDQYHYDYPKPPSGIERGSYQLLDFDGDGRRDLLDSHDDRRWMRLNKPTPTRPVFESIASHAGRLSIIGAIDPQIVAGGHVVAAEYWGDQNRNGRLDSADVLLGRSEDASSRFLLDVPPELPWAVTPTLVFARVQDDTGLWSPIRTAPYINPHATITGVAIEGHPRGRVRVGQEITFLLSGMNYLRADGTRDVTRGTVFIDVDASGGFSAGDIEIGSTDFRFWRTRRLTATVQAEWGVGHTVSVLASVHPRFGLASIRPAAMSMTILA